ncbi:MAG: hypothetical protein R6V31_10890 [Halohasta sp.]
MMTELYQYDGNSNCGGFSSGGLYWSSSDKPNAGFDYDIAYGLKTNGELWSGIKNYGYYVRPIRSF